MPFSKDYQETVTKNNDAFDSGVENEEEEKGERSPVENSIQYVEVGEILYSNEFQE